MAPKDYTLKTAPSPLIIAHRGERSRHPENTMAAFEGAILEGVPMIELDVTLTLDGVVVVIHDDSLDRTTNGHGTVREFQWESLKGLSAGCHFNPPQYEERIPTLEAVLQTFGEQVLINIEIKASAHEADLGNKKGIEQMVLAQVEHFGLQESVLISSFELGVLRRLRGLSSDISLALLTENGVPSNLLELHQELKFFSWNPEAVALDSGLIAACRVRDLHVLPFVINTESEARAALAMGCSGFFTDDLTLLQSIR